MFVRQDQPKLLNCYFALIPIKVVEKLSAIAFIWSLDYEGKERRVGKKQSRQLSTPQQGERWSDLMPILTWELWLARDLVAQHHLPWQKPLSKSSGEKRENTTQKTD